MKLYTKTQKSHDTLLIFGKTLTTIQLTFWLETLSEEQKPRVFDKTFLGLNHRFLRRCYKSQKPYRQDRNDWTAQNFPSKKLKLVITILSTGFTCLDWDITQRQVAGIL